MSPQDTVYSGITVTQTKKVKRARALFPSKHCAMMCLMRIGTLIFGLFLLPLKHAHLPTSPQDLKKHYAWDPLLPNHCDVPVFDPWDLPPESAPLLWAQEVQRTKRTPFGDEAQQQLQTAHSSCKQQKFSGQERRGKLYQIVIDQGDVENQIPLSCQMLHPLILSSSHVPRLRLAALWRELKRHFKP